MSRDIILIILGYLIPTFLAWLLGSLRTTFPPFKDWVDNHPNIAGVGLSALLAIPISWTTVVAYGRFFRPGPVPIPQQEMKLVTKDRDWSSPFLNSDKNCLVMHPRLPIQCAEA